MEIYGKEFYTPLHESTEYAARQIMAIVKETLPEIRSAVDVGCGVGTWLAVLKDLGVERIFGIEGPWLSRDLLQIPEDCFTSADLSVPLTLPERFDLAISLEVAEHLPPESAPIFVESLANLADFVLFSAAIPYQMGVHHVHLQWPDYWSGLFNQRGYVVVDVIRGRIWNDKSIPVWYRQNTLLFAKAERVRELTLVDDRISQERTLPRSPGNVSRKITCRTVADQCLGVAARAPASLDRTSTGLTVTAQAPTPLFLQ